MSNWVDNLVRGAEELLQKSCAKVTVDEIETARILERERMAREQAEGNRKLRAWERYFKGPSGIVKDWER